MSLPSVATALVSSVLIMQFVTSLEAQESGATCVPDRAVYARGDGTEFFARYLGRLGSETQATRYVEGEINGEKIAFTTAEGTTGGSAKGKFIQATGAEYAKDARFKIKWIEKPAGIPDQILVSDQGRAWAGEWKLVRCDGKSENAAKAIEAATTLKCPIDRTVFIDERSGRRFEAERYAEDFVYLHAQGESRTPPRDKAGRPTWAKRIGYWILQGRLDGSQAYIKYEQIQGAPCCMFLSYYAGDKDLTELRPKWLSDKFVPMVTPEGREALSAGEIDTYMGNAYRAGPMTGMNLVPVSCRSGK